MSDASSVQMTACRETTFATPATGAGGVTMRLTGESLKQVNETTRSEELRADRQTIDIIRRSIGASGQTRHEFSYGTYDDFLEAALLADATWTTPDVVTGANIASDALTTRITRSTGTWAATYTVGRWLKMSGWLAPNLSNNGFWKIVTVVSPTILELAGPQVMVTQAAIAGVTITLGATITNGVLLPSYSLHRKYSDLSSQFEEFLGMSIDKLGLTIPTSDKIGMTMDWLGKRANNTAPAYTFSVATTTPIMESVDHVPLVIEGAPTTAHPHTHTALGIVDGSFDLSNNLRQRLQVGSLGAISVGKGQCEVAGQVRVYFQTSTLFQKFLDHVSTNLVFVLQSTFPTPQSYVIELPRVKVTNGERVAGGINTDVIALLDFESYMHESETVTIRIARFP